VHALPEQIQRRGDALGVERRYDIERLLECVTRHEALRKAFGHAVAPHERRGPGLVREIEQHLAEHVSAPTGGRRYFG